MYKRLTLIVIAVLLTVSAAFAERIELGATPQDVEVTVTESNDLRTVIRFDVGAFSRNAVTIDSETHYTLSLGREAVRLDAGAPALPRISRSIIIPDDARMDIKIVSADYVDFPNTPIAPSKGNLLRSVNPADVPYTFGTVYSEDAWYPGKIAEIREPYILRDYRGTVVEFNAFQYNPAAKTLRVYTSVTVEILNVGPGKINVLARDKRAPLLDPDFDLLYQRRFINYGLQAEKYASVVERGDMLIITYDAFRTAMLPFVEWKKQKGIRTWMVNVSTIGNDGVSIANYIKNFYNADSTNLAFVLLVGDNDQVNKPIGAENSDPVYAKVAGSDSYPDLFIGRFSAETEAQVQTQVQRTIKYESDPPPGEWFHRGIGIGSNAAGTGQDGEQDWEHEDLIRDDLLNFTYTQVDRLYEQLGATAEDVMAAVDEGRSIINYTGHGSSTTWETTSFSSGHVIQLTNYNMPPFIISVACDNGDFDLYTCFAEAWLRATKDGEPTGAIGFYGSMITQTWSPPMDCQDEINDLLCARDKVTYGGLCFNGACKMIELNGSVGVAEYNAWAIFGDPSVMVWTDTPAPMSVLHPNAIVFGTAEIGVNIVGVADALCAIYSNGVLYGSAYTDAGGSAKIAIAGSLPVGEDVTLTVTAFNREPYIVKIPIVAPSGPFIVHDEDVIDDIAGNANGMIDYGENIALGMQLKNVGPDTAYGVSALLATSDPYITLTDDNELFGDISGDGGLAYIADAFAFDVSPDMPDNHEIHFTVTMTENSRDSVWVNDFSLTAHAPVLTYAAVTIDDNSGNDNGILDPGETAALAVQLYNAGTGQADAVTAVLSEADDFLTIVDADGTFDPIAPETGGKNSIDVFSVTADGACPRGHEATLTLTISAANGYETVQNFTVIVGDRVTFFADDFSFNQGWTGLGGTGEWTIGPATGGGGADAYGGADPASDHSPSTDNGVLGNDLTPGNGGDYANSMITTYWVTSPLLDCGDFDGVVLNFYRWLGVEQSSYDRVYLQAYDGSTWMTVFENGGAVLDDSSWNGFEYDVSMYADSNPDFQIRFGIGPTDGSMNFCGWNIDDVTLKGYGTRTSAEMAFGSEAVCDSLLPGDEVTDTIWVYNLSTEATLRVRFSSDAAWATCTTDLQLVAPQDSLPLAVTLVTTEMTPGDYLAHLAYTCNDYSQQYDTLNVQLHVYAPEIDIAVLSITDTLVTGDLSSHQVVISNIGPGLLEYTAGSQMFGLTSPLFAAASLSRTAPLGERPADEDKSPATELYYPEQTRDVGGPDAFGYSWIDSDEPDGPIYEWVDISGGGTALTLGDDAASTALPLGFDFPFYDTTYSALYVGSNGILTFDGGSVVRTNSALPSLTEPNSLIAMWWDDLDPGEGGSIRYYADAYNKRFIVSFDQIRNYHPTLGGTGSLTFQAILYSSGEIVLQYAVMDPGQDEDGLTGSTIGLENHAGNDGIAVAYNAPYIHDGMAIRFDAQRWMSISPGSGVIEPYASDTITVTFNASDLETGTYAGQLMIFSNDAETPAWAVPVSLAVQNYVCGDANGDERVNMADAVSLINYIFQGGPAPDPLRSGDANGDGEVNLGDAIHLINFIFKGGLPPQC